MQYIEGAETDRCFLCEALRARRAAERLILTRGTHSFIILNMFPYNTGHLMVAPVRHVSRLSRLKPEERSELMDFVCLAEQTIRKSYKPQGLNIGMNIGKSAGAGLPGHLHWHVVPRWSGDTNFLPVVADTKVMPESLGASYARLKKALRAVGSGQTSARV
jgi:ATP adenylyltransferase